MSKIQKIFILVAIVLVAGACESQKAKIPVTEVNIYDELALTDTSKIEVIYFHNKQRCANCIAVEEVTNEVVAGLDSAKIAFQTFAIGEKQNVDLESKLEITGPTLLLFRNNKTINLTTSAYLFARIKPEKFRSDLESAIKDLE